MRTILATLSAATVLLFSCQKERSLSSKENSDTDATGTLLVKMVTNSGTDSAVHVYSYNSSGQLIDMTTTGTDQGDVLFTQERIVRSSKGIIQKIFFKDADLIQSGIDSFIITAHYDEGLSRYTSRTAIIDYGLMILRDSSVFTYDANGKMVTESNFSDNGAGSYHPGGKVEYTYAGNNMATAKLYSYNSGSYEEEFTLTCEYDTKTSPLILGNEAFLIDYQGLGGYYSANNVTKQTVTYPSDPAETYTLTYTYNSSGLPATSAAHIPPGTTIYGSTYYYQ